jgi:hypothetical protein
MPTALKVFLIVLPIWLFMKAVTKRCALDAARNPRDESAKGAMYLSAGITGAVFFTMAVSGLWAIVSW